ncbi:hypothetical protein [Nesterenkonia sp. Act20]|uniref:hypothetical protein n=1 Tax=Nesterenkonia sp. Act20 TaxID=1483432 RepID=UPI001C493C68|nr:hypothetical protein [Nesterenkonia sp. Act20]
MTMNKNKESIMNHRNWSSAVALIGVLALSGCGSTEESAETQSDNAGDSASTTASEQDQTPETATEVAEAVTEAVGSATEVTEVTEDNDPNDLIGRPNGYTGAAVIADEGGEPSEDLGVDTGATVEQWGSESDAQARSDYIQEIQKEGGGILGSEWNYLHGEFLLRVSGELKPSTADEYEAAFNELF